jgi:hypothetical protein
MTPWGITLSMHDAVTSGGIAAGLVLVQTFCWAWRHRSLRKTLLALKQAELELERMRRDPPVTGSKPLAPPS